MALKREKIEQKVRKLLMRVATLIKTLTTSPLNLKIWKPHLLSLKSSHRLNLKG